MLFGLRHVRLQRRAIRPGTLPRSASPAVSRQPRSQSIRRGTCGSRPRSRLTRSSRFRPSSSDHSPGSRPLARQPNPTHPDNDTPQRRNVLLHNQMARVVQLRPRQTARAYPLWLLRSCSRKAFRRPVRAEPPPPGGGIRALAADGVRPAATRPAPADGVADSGASRSG